MRKNVIKEIIIAGAMCAALQMQQSARAQWFWNWTPSSPCASGQCNKPQQKPPVIKDDKEDTAEATDDKPAPLFVGLYADKWEAAFREVCRMRHISPDVIAKRQASLGGSITCTVSTAAAYAGCTWGGGGYVSRVDVVPSNCYNLEAVIMHESSHVVTFLTQDAATLFTHEGLAQLMEPVVQRDKMAHKYNPPADYIDWVYKNSYDGGLRVYSYSVTVFEYLRRAGGRWWLEAFAREVSKTGDFPAALRRWYGLNVETFNKNVKAFYMTGRVKSIC